MIQLTPHMKIFQCVEPVDFRKGIDGLAQLCKNYLKQDPFDGTVFVFINKKKSGLKLLIYDGQGFWLCQKRLSRGRIKYWKNHTHELTAIELQILLYNGSPKDCKTQVPWKRI